MKRRIASAKGATVARPPDVSSVEAETVFLSLASRAKRGDVRAAVLFQHQVDRGRRETLNFSSANTLDKIDKAMGQLLDAVACHVISPAEAAHIANILRARGTVIEQRELEARLARAERFIDEKKKQTFTERLAALEVSIAEVEALEIAEHARARERYGDNLERIVELEKSINELAGPLAGFTHLFERASEPLESMLQEVERLKGRDPRVWWEPDWRCPCGHTFTLWLQQAGRYRIYCEGCLSSCGTENEEAMYAASYREEGRDLDDDELKKLRFQNQMFRKCLRDDLAVPESALPTRINRLDARPRPELLEHVRKLIANRRPPGALDPRGPGGRQRALGWSRSW